MDTQAFVQAAPGFRSVLANLAPDLATELLELSRTQLVPLRGTGGFFGPEFVPPSGSPGPRALDDVRA